MTLSLHSAWLRASASIPVLSLALAAAPGPAAADETCQSPYMAKITGHEEFVYIWTLGVDGLGDGSDKVVTVDVRPDSPTFGEVVEVDRSAGGTRRTTATSPTTAASSGSRVSTPARSSSSTSPPTLRTRNWSRPSTTSSKRPAWSGRMRLRAARADDDLGALQLRGSWRSHRVGRVHQRRRVHLDALDAGRRGRVQIPARVCGRLRLRRARPAPQECHADLVLHRFGQLHAPTRQGDTGRRSDEALRPKRGALGLPRPRAEEGARCARRAARDPLCVGPKHNYCFTSTALTSKIWLIYEDSEGEWQAKRSPTSAMRRKFRCRSISRFPPKTIAVGRHVERRHGAVFDIRDPHQPKQISRRDRRTAEHGVGELGRRAHLFHVVAARELGQDGTGRRAVPQSVQLGW